MEELKILLNESFFSHVSKNGFVLYNSKKHGRSTVNLTRNDIVKLYNKEEVVKENLGDRILLRAELDDDIFKSIIRRSPIYSNIAL